MSAAGAQRGRPEVSVVLATSSLRAARRALEAYRRQTEAERIEVVLVAPTSELASIGDAWPDPAGALSLVEAEAPFDLARARAAGARAARADWIFIGETHSYPEPTLMATLFAARAASPPGRLPQAFVPAIYNANPTGAVSWASFLIDYGAWAPGLPDGAAIDPPIYNGLFVRELLDRLGDDLPRALSPHDDAIAPLPDDASHRAIFVARARIGHLNVVRPGDFARTKFQLGTAIGDCRAHRWTWARRLIYTAAAPCIALVLLRRYLGFARRARAQEELPRTLLPLLLLGAAAKAAGEAVGYLGLAPESLREQLEHLEVCKIDYVPGWSS